MCNQLRGPSDKAVVLSGDPSRRKTPREGKLCPWGVDTERAEFPLRPLNAPRRAMTHSPVKCIRRSFYTRRCVFPNPNTLAKMSLCPHSAVYHSYLRMPTSCFLYWSYNWGSEWGICTGNIMWKCGCVARKDTQTGIQAIIFILQKR